MTEDEKLARSVRILTERRDWLTERIKAKEIVGWDIEYDTRERDALAHVIEHMEAERQFWAEGRL